MPGVPRELTEHKLDLNPSSNKKTAIKKEITKLLVAGSLGKFFTLTGWPILYSTRRTTQKSGTCALTTQISTSIARRIPLAYLALIRS
jgi:hypothetical protein